MKREDNFYLFFILTVFLVRAWVLFFPQVKVIISNTLIHHFWIGVAIVLFVLILPKRYTWSRAVLLPIGLGLVVDELIYMIRGGSTVSEYWSMYSVFGAIVIVTLIFATRERLIKIFNLK